MIHPFDLAARAMARMAADGHTDIRKALDNEAPDVDRATDEEAERLILATAGSPESRQFVATKKS